MADGATVQGQHKKPVGRQRPTKHFCRNGPGSEQPAKCLREAAETRSGTIHGPLGRRKIFHTCGKCPRAGIASAYTYAYATLGENVAWIIGWDLALEYAVGNIAVAVSWSGYFCEFLRGFD